MKLVNIVCMCCNDNVHTLQARFQSNGCLGSSVRYISDVNRKTKIWLFYQRFGKNKIKYLKQNEI